MKSKKRIFKVGAGMVAVVGVLGGVWWNWWTAYGEGVRPRVAEHDVPALRWTLCQDEPTQLHLNTGTRLEIPAGAFVAADGSQPGEVELSVREFRSASDLLRAGIPMQLEPGGTDYLQSAGMIEIRAEADGEQLALRSGQALGVSLVSYRPAGEGYELWWLDDAGRWATSGEFATVANAERAEALQRLDTLQPGQPAAEPTEAWEFGLYGDAEDAPYLRAWKGVTWTWIPDFPGQAPPLHTLRGEWQKMDLLPRGDGTYDLAFHYYAMTHEGTPVEHTETLHAQPQLRGARLARVERDFQADQEQYAAALEQKEAQRRYYMAQGAFRHEFQARGLGYINIDKLEDAAQTPLLAARFDFEDGLRMLDKSELLMVMPEGQTLLSFQACDWDELPIPTGPVQLMVLLEDGTAAIVDAESFRSQVQAQAAPRPFLNSLTLRTRRVSRDEAFASLPSRPGSDPSSRSIP